MKYNDYIAIAQQMTEWNADVDISETPNGYQTDFTFWNYELNIKVIVTEDFTTITVLDCDFEDVHEAGTEHGSLEWIARAITLARKLEASRAAQA